MQQVREFPSILPEIVWGELDWFLSFEIWILILTPLCNFYEEKGIFSECFVENVNICKKLNFMLSKVFVNIKTVLQNNCTQCLYWLNFFFWVYMEHNLWPLVIYWESLQTIWTHKFGPDKLWGLIWIITVCHNSIPERMLWKSLNNFTQISKCLKVIQRKIIGAK